LRETPIVDVVVSPEETPLLWYIGVVRAVRFTAPDTVFHDLQLRLAATTWQDEVSAAGAHIDDLLAALTTPRRPKDVPRAAALRQRQHGGVTPA
jgi:hypothetical protein